MLGDKTWLPSAVRVRMQDVACVARRGTMIERVRGGMDDNEPVRALRDLPEVVIAETEPAHD